MLAGKALPPAKGLMLPAFLSSLTVLLRDLGCPCGECTAAHRTIVNAGLSQVTVQNTIPFKSSCVIRSATDCLGGRPVISLWSFLLALA